MSVPYSRIIAGIGLRLNAIVGDDPTALEATYLKTSFTQSDFDSGDWVFTFAKDLTIQAEGKFAWAIACVQKHPWRSVLHGVTNSIGKGQVIPSVSSAGDPIIGAYGDVRDASDNTICTEQPPEVIRRINNESWRRLSLYYYVINDMRCDHTRTNVVIDVCAYNAASQRTLINADQTNPVLLPDPLEGALICEGVSMAFRDDAFPEQAKQYRDYSNEAVSLIQQGLTRAPDREVPA